MNFAPFQNIESDQNESQAKRYLKIALEAAQMGVWHWNIKYNKITWDERSFLTFGLKPYEIEPNFEIFIDLVHPDDRDLLKSKISKSLNQKVPYDMIFRVIWPDESIHYLSSRGEAFFSESDEPLYMMGISYDITPRKLEEEYIDQKQTEMMNATRASAIREIASVFAHEINQPLSAVSMYMQHCLSKLERDNYSKKDLIHATKKSVELIHHAGQIIHRMKDFSQYTKQYHEVLPIKPLIKECLELIKTEIQSYSANINIKIKNQENLPLISADKIQIQQVIINLLRNSMEAACSLNNTKPIIDIEIFSDKNFLHIKIIDNGPGFDKHILNKSFETYFSTKNYGMGIGLSICHTIINLHEGKLSASNNPKKRGAVISIVLPLFREKK